MTDKMWLRLRDDATPTFKNQGLSAKKMGFKPFFGEGEDWMGGREQLWAIREGLV